MQISLPETCSTHCVNIKMANFQGFGEIFSNVSRSVLNSALNVAANSASRASDPFTVQEITGTSHMNDVCVKYYNISEF